MVLLPIMVYIHRPMYVTRIEDKNGNTISRFTPKIEEVLSEDQAYLMLNLLQGL